MQSSAENCQRTLFQRSRLQGIHSHEKVDTS